MSKIVLTEEHFNDILSFLKPLPSIPIDVANSVVENHRRRYIKQLMGSSIYPSQIPELKAILEKQFYKAQIEPGKSIGALSSTSIGEKNTQSTLSSFHQAGQLKVQLLSGVPRLEEILNVTKDIKTPSMDICFDLSPEVLGDLSRVKIIAQEILEYREIIDLLKDYDLVENREVSEEDEIWYLMYKTFYNAEFEQCSWSIRLLFDVDKLYLYRKSLSSIADSIHAEYADAHCVVSPNNIGIIDVYVNTDSIGDIDKIIAIIKDTRKKRKGKKSREEEDDEEDSQESINLLITEENKEYYFMRDLVIPSILFLHISGVPGIVKCFYEKIDEKWLVKTKGSNLKEVLKLPCIIMHKGSSQWGKLCTTSNHLWDIFETFGIEATRQFIHAELNTLVNVASRHLGLLIDSMTYSGKPMPASRYGIDVKRSGVLALISFEQPFDNFFKAAMTSEQEDTKGVSSCIIAGKVPPTGSGIVNLVDTEGQEISTSRMMYDFSRKMSLENEIKPQKRPAESCVRQTDFSAPATSFNTKRSIFNSISRPSMYVPNLKTPSNSEPEEGVTRIIIKKADKFVNKELNNLNPVSSRVFRQQGNVVEKTPIKSSKDEAQFDEGY